MTPTYSSHKFPKRQMTKTNLLNLAKTKNSESEIVCDCNQGIKERLLKKYRVSKVLRLIVGKNKDTKKVIAA